MKTKTKKAPQEINLEGEDTKEVSELDLEIAEFDDPKYGEEAKKRLHDIATKIDSLAQESRITLKKVLEEAGQEKGIMNKFAHFIKRMKDKATTDGSSAYNSVSFLTNTIKALTWYTEQIPVHISKFQSGINTLGKKKIEVTEVVKTIKGKIKEIDKELTTMKIKIEKETDLEKKEILRSEQQEIINKFQNTEIKGNKSLKDLQNLNNTTEMFLEMKGGYEILLKQVYNLTEELSKHKKILEVIGPSVAEVRKVVLTIDKFTSTIGEYRARDNQEVKLATKAIKEITPAIQDLERPWYDQKTIGEVKKNVKEAKEAYRKHFGHDITKLEDYDDNGATPPSEEDK